jgi:hypothetical protein
MEKYDLRFWREVLLLKKLVVAEVVKKLKSFLELHRRAPRWSLPQARLSV